MALSLQTAEAIADAVYFLADETARRDLAAALIGMGFDMDAEAIGFALAEYDAFDSNRDRKVVAMNVSEAVRYMARKAGAPEASIVAAIMTGDNTMRYFAALIGEGLAATF